MDDQTKNLIQNHIDTNDVCLFMKGTPDQPQCGFSMTVSNILKMLEINFKGVNVLEDQSLKIEELEKKLNESIEKNVELTKENGNFKRQDIIDEASKDLAETQKEKFNII